MSQLSVGKYPSEFSEVMVVRLQLHGTELIKYAKLIPDALIASDTFQKPSHLVFPKGCFIQIMVYTC